MKYKEKTKAQLINELMKLGIAEGGTSINK